MKHADIRVVGEVQGVGFRYMTRQKARELGLTGFVRNDPDESVYIEAEGEDEVLKKFLAWCREGLSYTEIKKVEYEFSDELKNFNDFVIE